MEKPCSPCKIPQWVIVSKKIMLTTSQFVITIIKMCTSTIFDVISMHTVTQKYSKSWRSQQFQAPPGRAVPLNIEVEVIDRDKPIQPRDIIVLLNSFTLLEPSTLLSGDIQWMTKYMPIVQDRTHPFWKTRLPSECLISMVGAFIHPWPEGLKDNQGPEKRLLLYWSASEQSDLSAAC